MYSEIIILDEIRSGYLAFIFQSRFAHSSGFSINRYQKVRQNFNTSMRPAFKINNAWIVVYSILRPENCETLCSKILKVVTFKTKYCIHNTSRTNQHLKIIFTGQKNAEKFGKFYFCQKIQFSLPIEWCLGIIVLLTRELVLPPLRGDLCKSGPGHFASEKSFPSNFAQ